MTGQNRSAGEVDVEMAMEQTEGLVSLGPLEPYVYLKMGASVGPSIDRYCGPSPAQQGDVAPAGGRSSCGRTRT